MPTMTAKPTTHAVLIARMRDGNDVYVSRSRKAEFTRHRNQAWVMTEADAYDMQQRFHAVQALGHYHQDVAFYDVCRVKNTRASR
jgi:hypothetical protein